MTLRFTLGPGAFELGECKVKVNKLIVGAVVVGLLGLPAAPAHAAAQREWYGFGCNYGYDVIIHSNGTNLVSHTMRSGGTSANNKTVSWNNPWWGAPRSWGYGYQTTTFAEAYTNSIFVTASSISCS